MLTGLGAESGNGLKGTVGIGCLGWVRYHGHGVCNGENKMGGGLSIPQKEGFLGWCNGVAYYKSDIETGRNNTVMLKGDVQLWLMLQLLLGRLPGPTTL